MVRAAVSRWGLAIFLFALASSGAFRYGMESVSAQVQTLTVEGKISNATAGGSEVAGLLVTLHRISIFGPDDLLTTSGENGEFRFYDVEFDPELSYGVSVRYQEAIYGTDIDLSSGSLNSVMITVFDSTIDDGVISASSASLLFASVDRTDQTISALEILRLKNSSDRAYVPGNEPMQLLRFGLPVGATNLQLDTRLIGADFAQVDLGFALFASVPPGEHEIMFSYDFPFPGDEFTLEKSYRYGADIIRVLAPMETVAIRSDHLGPVDSVTIGERPYQIIESGGIERGERITVQLGGLPVATATDRVSRNLDSIRLEYAAPAALATLMIGLVVYGGFWKRRRSNGEAPAASSEHVAERETIHQMIAELQETFEQGSLREDDYRRRLAILNSQLTSLGQYPNSGVL